VRVKLNQLSNQIFQSDEYHKFRDLTFPDGNKELAQRKARAIQKARNYPYKTGDREKIALKKFDRALRLNDLSEFPNVTYFHKKKLLERDMLTESLALIDGKEHKTREEVRDEELGKEKLRQVDIAIRKISNHLSDDKRLIIMPGVEGNEGKVDIE